MPDSTRSFKISTTRSNILTPSSACTATDELFLSLIWRVPPARGLIFDIDASGKVTLTKFHAQTESQFNRAFIAHIAGLTELPSNPGAPMVVQNPKCHDLEMLSDVLLGCRLKAPVHMHSVFNRNMLSLANNIKCIEKQAVQKQQRGIAEVHQHTTYSPCRWVLRAWARIGAGGER